MDWGEERPFHKIPRREEGSSASYTSSLVVKLDTLNPAKYVRSAKLQVVAFRDRFNYSTPWCPLKGPYDYLRSHEIKASSVGAQVDECFARTKQSKFVSIASR